MIYLEENIKDKAKKDSIELSVYRYFDQNGPATLNLLVTMKTIL